MSFIQKTFSSSALNCVYAAHKHNDIYIAWKTNFRKNPHDWEEIAYFHDFDGIRYWFKRNCPDVFQEEDSYTSTMGINTLRKLVKDIKSVLDEPGLCKVFFKSYKRQSDVIDILRSVKEEIAEFVQTYMKRVRRGDNLPDIIFAEEKY